MKHEPLNEFEPVDFEAWRAAAERGQASLEDLSSKNRAGLTIPALYRQEDLPAHGAHRRAPGEPPYIRGRRAPGRPWRCQHGYDHPEPDMIGASIARDLERGLESPWISLDLALRMGGGIDESLDGHRPGTSIARLDQLRTALQPLTEPVPLFVEAGVAGLPMLASLLALADERGWDASKLDGGVLCDPIGVLAQAGGLAIPLERAFAATADCVHWAGDRAPNLAVLQVSAVPWHDGGAGAIEEAAFAVASGIEYLRILDRHRLDITHVVPHMLFQFAVGDDPFVEMAKLRAARLLWAGVMASSGASTEHQAMRITARTSWHTRTRQDPWVNMLRSTVEVFAAACGGADDVMTRPFDEASGASDEFGDRMALNTQTILREESHLDRVADPAGGSWYLESLTDAIARSAWQLVQAIESEGGMVAALRNGTVQNRIQDRARIQEQELREGHRSIVGVTEFVPSEDRPTNAVRLDRARTVHDAMQDGRNSGGAPELNEWLDAVHDAREETIDRRMDPITAAMKGGATTAQILAAHVDGGARIFVDPVPRRRMSEPFEDSTP